MSGNSMPDDVERSDDSQREVKKIPARADEQRQPNNLTQSGPKDETSEQPAEDSGVDFAPPADAPDNSQDSSDTSPALLDAMHPDIGFAPADASHPDSQWSQDTSAPLGGFDPSLASDNLPDAMGTTPFAGLDDSSIDANAPMSSDDPGEPPSQFASSALDAVSAAELAPTFDASTLAISTAADLATGASPGDASVPSAAFISSRDADLQVPLPLPPRTPFDVTPTELPSAMPADFPAEFANQIRWPAGGRNANSPSFFENASALNAASAAGEKLHVEIEISDGSLKRDSVLMFTAMEPAFKKLIDHMGERERFEAFAREASRRACYGK